MMPKLRKVVLLLCFATPMLIACFSLSRKAYGAENLCKQHASKIEMPNLAAEIPEVKTKLARGLTVTMVHQMPFGEWKCSVLLDLWDEVYAASGGWIGKEPSRIKTKKIADALLLCSDIGVPSESRIPEKFELITIVDPVSEEQMARTRKWLAERGIGKGSSAIVGRAVGAILDLKDNRTIVRSCVRGRQ